MIRRCGLSTLLALSTAFAALPLQAQVGGAGSVVNGRVVVQVFVTLSDDATPYHPVSGLPLGFIRTPRDTSIAVTDRSGSAILLLAPGKYRVVSLAPTHWKSVRYTWNTPIDVQAEMGQINLRRNDAASVKVTATVVTASNGETVEHTIERPVEHPVERPAEHKDVRPAPAVEVVPVAAAAMAPAPAPATAAAAAAAAVVVPVAVPVPDQVEKVEKKPDAPAKVANAKPMPRPVVGGGSRTSGLFIGLGAEGNGLLTNVAGSSRETGVGGGIELGYGFTRHFALYADASGAQMNQTAGGTYILGHGDVGIRMHLLTGHRLVPFLQFAGTYRMVSTTQTGTTYSANGMGGSAGLGFNLYFMRSVALSTSADWSLGNFTNYQIDNLGLGAQSVSAQTARVHVGFVWFP